jgi:hypothetical protein
LLVAHVGPRPRVPTHACPGMQRWRGHRPPPHADAVGRPPRSLHAPRMRPPPVRPYLALPWSKGEASPLPQLLTAPGRCSTPLPPIAFLGREDLPDASPLRPTPGLVFTFPSTTEPWSTSPTSPFSPTSATPTPHRCTPPLNRHRHCEPATVSHPSPFAPKSGSPSTGLTPRPFSHRPTAAGRSDSAGEPPVMREFFPPLFLWSRAEIPKGAGLSRPSRAVG